LSQGRPDKKTFRYRNALAIIAIVFLFVVFSWWVYYSITQPTIPTTATTSLGLFFISDIGKGCLQSNPETREVFAFYHVTVTERDNISVQYEATYEDVMSVTYTDNRVSPIGIFPKHLMFGPAFGTTEKFDLAFPINGTAYGRPNATVIGGVVSIWVVIKNELGQNMSYETQSPLGIGHPNMFSSNLPSCGTQFDLLPSNSLLSSRTESIPSPLAEKSTITNSCRAIS
jgi:hypothetical protein